MTKSELIEQISEQLNLPIGRAEQLVNCIFDSMIHALEEGEGIEIRGFGSFSVREYKSYDGRNPRTGEAVHVAPKRLPFFKVGKDLRDRVDKPAPPVDPSSRPRSPSPSDTGTKSAGTKSDSTSSDRAQSSRRADPYDMGDGSPQATR